MEQLLKKNKSPLAQSINYDYEQFLNKEGADLNKKLTEEVPNYVCSAFNQQSKVNTLGFLSENILNMVGAKDKEVKSVLAALIGEYKKTFEDSNGKKVKRADRQAV